MDIEQKQTIRYSINGIKQKPLTYQEYEDIIILGDAKYYQFNAEDEASYFEYASQRIMASVKQQEEQWNSFVMEANDSTLADMVRNKELLPKHLIHLFL